MDMPNIAITTYCNLKCPYCFADDMICEQHENISIDQFKHILQWISRSPENHIGIIGGEPTIHPHFDEIMTEVNRYCRELGTECTLFTNGIYLDKWLHCIGNSTFILINCNAPENMSPEQYTKFWDTITHLRDLDWFHRGSDRATLGCNIYYGRNNYDYIWDLVDYCNVDKLRISVTAPIVDEYKKKKEWYYTELKPVFLDFLHKAKEHQIMLNPDCNQIPLCYFSSDELKLMEEVMPDRMPGICEPVIDITPQFTATSCFGCYDPVDCSQFETVIDLRRYLLHRKNFKRVEANCTGKCIGCKMHELMLCQGGCLAFADEGKL